MPADVPFFHVPLNLPHAARVARRIVSHLSPGGRGTAESLTRPAATAVKLEALLAPCGEQEDNPPAIVAKRLREEAAGLARQLVVEIEARPGAGHDRLGQSIRNLFECLELGREGAVLGLRAGENPRSLQRPV